MQRVAQSQPRTGGLLKSSYLSQSARSICSTTPLKSQSNPDKSALNGESTQKASKEEPTSEPSKQRETTKSMAQEDEELRRRLEDMSGEGGAAGIEYEDGKPQAMKRSVRNNMFRYI
ncbi:hypothetical protein BDV12DRAFT_123655 [Aspergillus spectabilis]